MENLFHLIQRFQKYCQYEKYTFLVQLYLYTYILDSANIILSFHEILIYYMKLNSFFQYMITRLTHRLFNIHDQFSILFYKLLLDIFKLFLLQCVIQAVKRTQASGYKNTLTERKIRSIIQMSNASNESWAGLLRIDKCDEFLTIFQFYALSLVIDIKQSIYK